MIRKNEKARKRRGRSRKRRRGIMQKKMYL